MGVAAILVMWPGPFEQTFVSIWNLNLISQITHSGFRGELIEIVDGWTTDDRVPGILLAHPWAFGLSELKKEIKQRLGLNGKKQSVNAPDKHR